MSVKLSNLLGKRFKPWHALVLLLVVYDLVTVGVSYYLALALRFERLVGLPRTYLGGFSLTLKLFPVLCVLVYYSFKLYNSIWKFASYHELIHCIAGVFLSFPFLYFILHFGFGRMPISYYVFGGTFQLVFLLFSRFIGRIFYLELSNWKKSATHSNKKNYGMLIGAGSAGQMILRDIATSNLTSVSIRCIIDDDADKWGRLLDGIPIVGGRDDIPENVRRYHITQIYLAIPTASHSEQRRILDICQETGCEVKLLPGIYQFANDEVSLSQMRTVEVDDLLDRAPVKVNQQEIAAHLADQKVLVTGGGGSIGAELCRQIAACQPAQLIIFDIYENNAYFIQQELRHSFPDLNLKVLIGSVLDARRVERVFRAYRPDIVFHAASHKHVPLMEESPWEAIKNNVGGTYTTACAALANGCRHFVFLSSDKAVNPTSVLGAASRLGEQLMQTLQHLVRSHQLQRLFPPCPEMPRRSDELVTEFSAIRFGNVLGSGGSVMGIFQKQIAAGGPVLVTHPDVTRFCMSLTETVRLLLQASCYAKDGEVFVLDMGEPFRIDDLARRLIKLSGFTPGEDIKIEYTGLRPGEKLHEEPLMWEEGMRKTSNPRIYVANPVRLDFEGFLRGLEELRKAADNEAGDLGARLARVVNSYHKPSADQTAFAASELARPQEPINVLEQIAERFVLQGKVTAVVPLNSGYINRTYRVDTADADGAVSQYTLQRINTEVFPDPSALMENFSLVTAHLAERLRLPGRPNELASPTLMPTRDGQNFLQMSSGAWRMMNFFTPVHSYDIPENPQVFYHSGVAFGSFLQAMADFPPERLHEVIPNFHNTWSRYQDLEAAIARDPVGRVAAVQKEIEFVRAHRELFKTIAEPLQKGKIPTRIGHNDCNLNNILFDNATNLPVAIIDLDTVMPSSPLYDFGDSMRIGTNTAKDDEKDLSKVSCDLNLYEHYARGWLEACGKMLTPKERELLPYASLVITSEDGIRFLMDHINGDTYYYIFYLGQNLDRARTQLALLADMERKLPQIKAILEKLFVELAISN
ncbi:MAG: polysaccharide biosynthesis protein [Victivallales bacterium]|nr:polysaccharide biosynthesis protein [Victivallales bacterium]